MRGTVWAVANQLGVVASTPAELLSALLSGPPRTVRLEPGGHDPDRVAELAGVLGEFGHVRLVLERPADEPSVDGLPADGLSADGLSADGLSGDGPACPGTGDPEPAETDPLDLSDVDRVCAADPARVTAAYEAHGADHGGLRDGWLRAGQSLIREQDPAGRALVLLAALPADADPRVGRALRRASAGAPWSMEWSRPCQVAALTVSAGFEDYGGYEGSQRSQGSEGHEGSGSSESVGSAGSAGPAGGLVVADPAGGIRTLPDTLRRLSSAARVRAVAAPDHDTRLLLDERGRLHRIGGAETPLTKAVTATLESHPGTALAAAADTVLVGDRMGSVHAFGLDGLHQAALHAGRVTALAATASPSLVVHSGGTDGTVHRWSPGSSRHGKRVSVRPYPVVALHAASTPAGPAVAVAWADGLAELHLPGMRKALPFRPGPAVRAVAVTPDGMLCVGTDQTLIGLRPR